MAREDLVTRTPMNFPALSATERGMEQFKQDVESLTSEGVFGGSMKICTAEYTISNNEYHKGDYRANLQAAVLLELHGWGGETKTIAFLSSPLELIQLARQILRDFEVD